MVTGTWNDGKEEPVCNCFRKAGFVLAEHELSETCNNDAFCKLAHSPGVAPAKVSPDEFVNRDSSVDRM